MTLLGGAANAVADAKKCTATTCCQMVTEQDLNGVQQTKCQSRMPAGALCEGSCKAKDLNEDGDVSIMESRALCSCSTYTNLAAAQVRAG